MSDSFDAYHKWLGIAPHDQPPTCYMLLGISDSESDPEVISNAADQRMAFIRSFQTGPHLDAATRLLNEIAAARVRLLQAGEFRDVAGEALELEEDAEDADLPSEFHQRIEALRERAGTSKGASTSQPNETDVGVRPSPVKPPSQKTATTGPRKNTSSVDMKPGNALPKPGLTRLDRPKQNELSPSKPAAANRRSRAPEIFAGAIVAVMVITPLVATVLNRLPSSQRVDKRETPSRQELASSTVPALNDARPQAEPEEDHPTANESNTNSPMVLASSQAYSERISGDTRRPVVPDIELVPGQFTGPWSRKEIEELRLVGPAAPQLVTTDGLSDTDVSDLVTDRTQYIKQHPDSAEAYTDRGIFNSRIGDHYQAIDDFSQAIHLNPDYPKPYFNRGVVLLLRHRHDEAIADFERVLSLDPSHEAAQRHLEAAVRRKAASLYFRPKNARDAYEKPRFIGTEMRYYQKRAEAKQDTTPK